MIFIELKKKKICILDILTSMRAEKSARKNLRKKSKIKIWAEKEIEKEINEPEFWGDLCLINNDDLISFFLCVFTWTHAFIQMRCGESALQFELSVDHASKGKRKRKPFHQVYGNEENRWTHWKQCNCIWTKYNQCNKTASVHHGKMKKKRKRCKTKRDIYKKTGIQVNKFGMPNGCIFIFIQQ